MGEPMDSYRDCEPSTSPSPYGKGKSKKNRKVKLILPPYISFNLETKEFDGLTEDIVLGWIDTYPKINVVSELQHAQQWLAKQPYKPEYDTGASRYFFLDRWLRRSNGKQ